MPGAQWLQPCQHMMKGPCKAALACEILSRLAELRWLRSSACAAAEVSAASMARPMRMAAAGAWSAWAKKWNESMIPRQPQQMGGCVWRSGYLC